MECRWRRTDFGGGGNERRRSGFRIGPIDVLVLEEVIAEEQVEAAARAIGHPHWVISDFSPPPNISGGPFNSLEVAVISRPPITSAAEWDLTGQGEHGDDFAPRPSSDQILTEELGIDVPLGPSRPSRGFLRVDLEDGPSVYAVHWKSSLGQSCNADDIDFARQREDQASGLIVDAQRVLAQGRSVVVAGDYNIQAPGRVLRVGTSAERRTARRRVPARASAGLGVWTGMTTASMPFWSSTMPACFRRHCRRPSSDRAFPAARSTISSSPDRSPIGFKTPARQMLSGTSSEGSDHRPVIAVFSTTSEETQQDPPSSGRDQEPDRRDRGALAGSMNAVPPRRRTVR